MTVQKQTGRWTPEARAKQAKAIRSWAPWNGSTGPQTTEGKATVARNAYSGGHWRAIKEFSKTLNAHMRSLQDIRETTK